MSNETPSHELTYIPNVETYFLPPTSSYYIIRAEIEERTVSLAYLKREKKKHAVLVRDDFAVAEGDVEAAREWCKAVMEVAYEGASMLAQ